MLVFWMNAGFATLEAGLCRRKNAVHILAKNFIVFAVSSIAFWVAGFGMMFGGSIIGGEEVPRASSAGPRCSLP
jgi:Amt family ammonium transporter